MVVLLGQQMGTLVGGSVVVETVFAIPGMGRLAYEAVVGRDALVLVGVLLAARRRLVAHGDVTITINDDPDKALKVAAGGTLLGTLAPFHHEANFRLKSANFGTGFVQKTLCLIDLIACRVMRLTNCLELCFYVAKISNSSF